MIFLGAKTLYDDGFSQQIVDAVSAVFDGNYAAVFLAGNNGYGFAAVASEGKQKSVQLFVVGLDPLNDIFFGFFGHSQVHMCITCKKYCRVRAG